MGFCACVRQLSGLVGLVLALVITGAARADVFVVTSGADSGAGTLRAAITAANGLAGPHTIEFAVPTSDPSYVPGSTDFWRISLLSPLPALIQPTTIDGWSQRTPPGPGLPIIELNGAGAGAGDGLVLGVAECVVRGLTIGRFTGSGLAIQGATTQRCWVYGCNFGVDPFGLLARPNTLDGVQFRQGAFRNRIGTNGDGIDDDAESCILSGNTRNGLRATGSGQDNMLSGCRVGTDISGFLALPNGGGGIVITGAERTIIGTDSSGDEFNMHERNLISGNTGSGIFIEGAPSTGSIVSGNFIGTDATGAAALPNTGDGVFVAASPTVGEHRIGAGLGFNFDESQPNVIAFNGLCGVIVTGGVDTSILSNSIYNNGELGIDLAPGGVRGVTFNDALDVDGGPNNLQNFAIALSVTPGGVISFVLNSEPLTAYRVELFLNRLPDPSELGEGQVFLGGTDVTTNAAGTSGVMNFSFDPTAHPDLVWVTATATELPPIQLRGGRGILEAALGGPTSLPGSTSEFSFAVPLNFPPIALAQTVDTFQNTDVTITLEGVDPEMQPVTATISALPANGSLLQFGTLTPIVSVPTGVTDPMNRVVFRPDPGETGSPYTTFQFRVSDEMTPSSPATVTVNVIPLNLPPVAVDDAYVTNEDSALNVPALTGVLFNDSDPDNDTLEAVLVAGPANAQSFSLNADGSFSFSPTLNFSGLTSFTYQARDPDGELSNIATVRITVNPINDPPIANNDSYSTNEDTSLSVPAVSGVLSNDTDVDGGPLSAQLVTGPANAQSFALNSNGSFSYTPTANFTGSTSFTYRAFDGSGLSNIATVNINVLPVNDPPVANNDSYSTNEDTALAVPVLTGVLSNDTDIDSATLTAQLVSGPANAQSFALNADGSFSYTPTSNFSGSTSFTYRASDGSAQSNIATVTINVLPINDPPIANNDTFNMNEDTSLNPAAPGVLGNDTDIDGGPLSAQLAVGPAHAQSFSLNANGSFSYTPVANFNGVDTFTYRAFDGSAQSNIATVTINIAPINDPPVANNDTYSTNEDTSLTVPVLTGVLSNDTDLESDALTAELVSPPANAAAFALNANGSFTFTPAANFNGSTSFTYRAFDGLDRSNVATVTINVNPINDVPVANDDSYSTDEDVALSVPAATGVLFNDTDADNQPLTAQLVSPPANAASFNFGANGSFSFTPTANFFGQTTFTYRAFDGTALSNVATVRITVNPVNDPPVARCRDVVIDARTECVSMFITVEQVDNGSSDLEDGFNITRNLSNFGPFPPGESLVTLTVTDSGGLPNSCTATVTVLAEDCQPNGIPDSCEVAGGELDCNMNVVPDTCECFWDNGEPPLDGTAANGLLSHEGGGAPLGVKAAEDFYLKPGEVHRINGFTGYLLTSSHVQIRHAKVEFYNDCNGQPDGEPIATFDESEVVNVTPSRQGFDLVTFFFDLCDESLWLEGGKTYWVSFYGVTDMQMTDLSFWAIDEASGPHALAGTPPRKAEGVPSSIWGEFDYGPWEPVEQCCVGCVNLAFKLRGESCKVLWDNGRPDLGQGKGGSPSGANRSRVSRTADNFITTTCEPAKVCLIQAWIWTNCDPVHGFIDLYENDCKLPNGSPIFSAAPTRVVETGETALIEGSLYNGYCLELEMPNLTLLPGRNYWLSAGAHSTGNYNTRTFFANALRDCNSTCFQPQITPGVKRDTSPTPTDWALTTHDYAFRIAVRQAPVMLPAIAPPTGPACRADADDSGTIEVADIFTFLSAWFAGCP